MLIKEKQVNPTWKPEVYSKLSFAQAKAAMKMLKLLKIDENAQVLDVGCGDGKISAKLSNIVKKGSVLGLDKSVEMFNYANTTYGIAKYPNLKFSLQDAQEINFHERFDLVFSSFAIQWFKDKNLFFRKVYKALKMKGTMCIIMPLGISPELEHATKMVTESSEWKEFFNHFHPNWHFIEGLKLLHLAKENSFNITYSSTYTMEVNFPSVEDFEEYVLLWFPYLAPLEKDLKSVFFAQIIKEYCKLLPPKKGGRVSMRIPIISFIASKINL